MRSKRRGCAIGGLAALLAACGGDPGGSICGKAFEPGETFLFQDTTGCPACTDEDSRAMIDGSASRAARVIFNADGTSPAGGGFNMDIVRGRRFTGAGTPGAYVTFPEGNFAGAGISFSTYLDGEHREDIACEAESGSGGCGGAGSAIGGAGAHTWYGGPSTLSFDQVRMTITMNGVEQETTVLVHEVCASR